MTTSFDSRHGIASEGDSAQLKTERLGAAPSLKNIEYALQELTLGKSLFISESGEATSHKTPFLTGDNEILMTIARTGENRFSVYPGLGPTNPTFCVLASDRAETKKSPLRYSAVLKSGDSIVMADLPVPIPSRLKSAPSDPVEKMQSRLMKAEIGERVILGRLGNEIPRDVSRGHVSVFIRGKEPQADGSTELTVEVTPGVRARKTLSIQLNDGEYRKAMGVESVIAGTRLFLPDIGIIHLPYDQGSSENMIESILESRRPDARPLQTFMHQPVLTTESQHARNQGAVKNTSLDRALIGRAVARVITDGLSRIRSGDFEGAMDLFRNSGVLTTMGYRFEENRMFSLNEITEQGILRNVYWVASNSWFQIQNRLVYPSVGGLMRGLEAKTESEHELLNRWRKEMALIYAEEYTHAYQDWVGGPVSRHAPLIADLSYEADVAALFYDHGVHLSNDFVQNRYRKRETALRRIVGAQTSADIEAFRDALSRLPLGATLTIGSKPDSRVGDASLTILPVSMPHSEDNGRTERQRERARRTFHDTEISLTKARDGSFVFKAEHSETRAFYRDQEGYIQMLREPVALSPGSTIYFGDSFRFNLGESPVENVALS